MIATHRVRTLEVSAASGLVLRDGCFYIVADDENALFVFGAGAAARRIELLPGELPIAHAARKKHKPDFEILVDLPDHGVLAMGSGSRASRERAVLVDRHEHTRVIDTAAVCAVLRETFEQLNLEGAALVGDEFAVLQRGNRRDRRNALIYLATADLERALRTQRFTLTRAPRIVDLHLGAHDDVPWTGTDLCALPGGDLLVSAVLEDTRDAYHDGRCAGAALVRLAPDGSVRWQRRLDTAAKVEGVAIDGDSVWLVSDADDRAVPAQLLHATLP